MSTSSETPRVARGVPSGGQWTQSAKGEAGVVLGESPDTPVVGDIEHVPHSYTFPAWKLDRAVKSIDKANRRAERAGIVERFSYEVEMFDRSSTDPHTGIDTIEPMATLTLDRPTVQHDGWEFAGTLSWDDEVGMVSRIVPGAELTDRPQERFCDVCGSTRDRKDTYVVQRTDPETGEREQLQVGSNCLTRFMGIRPAGLWMLEFDIDEASDSERPERDTGPLTEPRFDSGQVLSLGLAVVERYGWVSRSAAQAGVKNAATADRVDAILAGRPHTDAERREHETILARAAEIRAAGDGDALLDEARHLDGDSEYAMNMRAVASSDSVSNRNLGLLLSAIAARQVRVAREAESQAKAASQHVGTPKEKLTGMAVTVDSVSYHDGDYGVRTLVSMRDGDGNVIKWWASGRKEYTEGKTYTMAATVKGHGEYRDVKETTVIRAKLEDPDADPPPEVPTANPKSIFAKYHDIQSLNASADRSLSRLSGDAYAAREAEYEARREEIRAWRRNQQD